MSDRVGIMMVGANGSIATTLTTGVFAVVSGLSEHRCLITDHEAFAHLNLLPLDAFHFGGWDLRCESHARAAMTSAEAPQELLQAVSGMLSGVRVATGVSLGISAAARAAVDSLQDSDTCRADAAERIEREIRLFVHENALDGAVLVNLASTEPPVSQESWHHSLSAFEAALARNEPLLTAGMIYAYAGMRAGAPVLNYTPSDVFEIPALLELSRQKQLPLAGRDGKTGQTFYKTVLAPAFRARAFTVDGWFSTNILGNGDGKTLAHASNLEAKRRSKLGSLATILGGEIDHQVHIHHYAPRAHAKEAWDSIDMRGWLGVPIQMKINWVAPDSALAAPMVLDVVRLLWWAKKNGRAGVQSFLAPFFKEPLGCSAHGFAEQFELLLAATRPSTTHG